MSGKFLMNRRRFIHVTATSVLAAPYVSRAFGQAQGEVIQRYASPVGFAILVGGAVLCFVAYRLMMWIGRLPTERRILS